MLAEEHKKDGSIVLVTIFEAASCIDRAFQHVSTPSHFAGAPEALGPANEPQIASRKED